MGRMPIELNVLSSVQQPARRSDLPPQGPGRLPIELNSGYASRK